MDLLSRRYASPFFVVDEMLSQGRFFEFVCEINKIADEEETKKKLWDIWIHRVFDKSFDEWKQQIESRMTAEQETTQNIEATVKNSKDILCGFNPQTGG